MAYTTTELKNTVLGDLRVRMLSIAADAVSGVVDAGMSVVVQAMLSPVSMATSGVKVKINATTAAAAQAGKINVADAASGDVFYLTVYGR